MRNVSALFHAISKTLSKSRLTQFAALLLSQTLASQSPGQNAETNVKPDSIQAPNPGPGPQPGSAVWLQTLTTHFENQYASTVLEPFNSKLAAARRAYLEKLEVAVARAANAGSEPEAAQLREERERFFNAGRLAPAGDAPSKVAHEIRTSFRAELAKLEKDRAAASKLLHAQFDGALVRAQTALLQSGLSAEAGQVALRRAAIARDWLAPATAHPGARHEESTEPVNLKNRAAAEAGVRWLLGLEGQISYFSGYKRVPVTVMKDWPSGRVQVASVSLTHSLNTPETRGGDFLKLAPLRGTRELSINGFPVGDDALAFLDEWRDLVRLSLSGLNVSDALGQRLARFKTLLHLALSNCPKLTPEVLTPLLESAEDLLSLQLVGENFGDSWTEVLNGFHNLETLNLSSTEVTNSGLSNLSRLRSLRNLNIQNTHVTPEGLESLAGLRLRSVSFLSTDMPDFEAAAAALAKVQPHLESLPVAGAELRPEHVAALKAFRHLTRLDLLTNQPQPGSIEALCVLPALENLRSGSPNFCDDHLEALTRCSQLNSLDVSSTSVTDKGLAKLRSLKELRLLRAPKDISDSTAQRLRRVIPGLNLYR